MADKATSSTPTISTPVGYYSPITNPAIADTSTSAAATTPTPSSSAPDPLAGALGLGSSLWTAYRANKQNAADINNLENIRKPLTDAGSTYLNNALSGALTPGQQKQYNDLVAQSNTLTNQANPLISQATQGIAQAMSGQLPSWQQTQLDNATAAAIAQLRSQMGPNVDSSTMAMMESQIRQQAQITAGQMEQQNLQTYEQLYTLGATTQKEAMALLDAANQSVITNLQQDFANAISAFAGGNAAAMDKINASMAQDKVLSEAIGKIVNGMTTANGKSALDVVGGKVGDAIKKLLGMDSTPDYVTSGQYQTDVSQYLASNPLEGTSTAAPADWLASQGLNADGSAVTDPVDESVINL
jgi:hypothetical protein